MREVLTILFYKSMESGGGGNGMEDWAIGCVWLELYSHLIETPTLTQSDKECGRQAAEPGTVYYGSSSRFAARSIWMPGTFSYILRERNIS